MAETLNVDGKEVYKDPNYICDPVAMEISDKWVKWDTARIDWLTEKKELREYIFATDTRKTSNSQLPWKNSTVTPKLTQIRDNLHANYIAALFPADNWFIWESNDKASAEASKKDVILAYMQDKLKASKFDLVVSQLVLDYIDYGNVFVGHEFVSQEKIDPATGEKIPMYRGPRAFRISPLDVVLDPTAPSFERTPIIIRTIKSLGDFKSDIETKPGLNYDPVVVDKIFKLRTAHQTQELTEQLKSDGMVVDGFGSIEEYLSSSMIELLEFYGDYYNSSTGELHRDMIITIVDRRWVLRKISNPSWLGRKPIFHCGWRLRPDNLWAQGPLDQLVGMQYRIDHLENLKADVFDQIAHPITAIYGDTVEDFVFAPGAQIHLGAEGKIEILRPDATALNADMQILDMMNKMEELAGAPRQAMGIRTPGEKTKYEVQVLENGAGRIFQNKATWFEKNIIDPILNSMLEESVRNLGTSENIRFVDPELGTELFKTITKKDLQANGHLYPVGARHFAEQAKFVQDLTTTLQLVENLPSVKPHISGKATAKALEEALGWKRFNLVKDNIAVSEQAETQRLINSAAETLEVENNVPAELQSEDMLPNEQSTTTPPPQGL
jgi:hypothetical protein